MIEVKKDITGRIEDFDRKYVATEGNMGWFCDKCDKFSHWRTKAFVHNNHSYCRECAQRMCNDEKSR